jgi:hypothetical protein
MISQKGLTIFQNPLKLRSFRMGARATYLTKLTTLSKPSPFATLLLYLVASPTTVSAVLVEEKEHKNKMKQWSWHEES